MTLTRSWAELRTTKTPGSRPLGPNTSRFSDTIRVCRMVTILPQIMSVNICGYDTTTAELFVLCFKYPYYRLEPEFRKFRRIYIILMSKALSLSRGIIARRASVLGIAAGFNCKSLHTYAIQQVGSSIDPWRVTVCTGCFISHGLEAMYCTYYIKGCLLFCSCYELACMQGLVGLV
jgi:hypothetical protein